MGCLQPHLTVTDFRVYPFVGWIEPPVEFFIDAAEVAEVFEVPLGFVLDPANHKCESAFLRGEQREFYVLDYPGHRIWGATAAILIELARALAPEQLDDRVKEGPDAAARTAGSDTGVGRAAARG